MSSPIEVIINAGSGSVQSEEIKQILEGLFKESGVEANIHLAKQGSEIIKLAQLAVKSDCKIIVAGGGDGTVSGVASEL